MKKTVLVPLFAVGLLLAACNSTEENVTESSTPEPIEQTQQENAEESTPEKVVETEKQVETEEVTDVSADSQTEVKVYQSDDHAENIILSETVTHSFKEDGPITKFILNELELMPYYNGHTVSGDEKIITIDFKEDIIYSQLVQGTTGGWIFVGEIYASFFNTLPKLEVIQLRINGEELELDHVSFAGQYTRENFTADYPSVEQ